MLQNATPLRKSAPGLPNSSDEHVSCTAPATEHASLQILFQCPTPAIVFGNATKPSRFAHFCKGAQSRAPACHAKRHRNVQKWSKHVVLFTFWHRNAQRHALVRHLNFQKWSETEVFWTFWLRTVLLATTACTFSSSQLLKVVRTWCALYILTSKRASHHNGVHFFDISTSKSAPELVCFVHFDFEMCFAHLRATTACNFSSLIWPGGSAPAALASPLFDLPEPQIIGKNTVFRDFPTFSRTWIFFLLKLSLFWYYFFFSSLRWLFPSLLFICPYCRKFDF